MIGLSTERLEWRRLTIEICVMKRESDRKSPEVRKSRACPHRGGLVPPASLCLSTRRGYQADFNSRCVVDKMDADFFHRFIVLLGTRRAAWRLSQGCDCVARELK